MTTLLVQRTALNGEIGVSDDNEASPWSKAVRNQAIVDGYRELWRAGVWKPVTQSLATVNDQVVYALTSIRRKYRLELLDSSSRLIGSPRGVVEDDGAGGYQLHLFAPLASGSTLKLRGWTTYSSALAADGDNDDLPAEHARIPLLKAKAILYRQQLARFVRYESKPASAPEMNTPLEGLLATVAAAEREFTEEAAKVARLRPRASQTRSV